LFKGFYTSRQQQDKKETKKGLQASISIELYEDNIEFNWLYRHGEEKVFSDLFFELTNARLTNFMIEEMNKKEDKNSMDIIKDMISERINDHAEEIMKEFISTENQPKIKPSEVFGQLKNKLG
jgi:hypothetical protein